MAAEAAQRDKRVPGRRRGAYTASGELVRSGRDWAPLGTSGWGRAWRRPGWVAAPVSGVGGSTPSNARPPWGEEAGTAALLGPPATVSWPPRVST